MSHFQRLPFGSARSTFSSLMLSSRCCERAQDALHSAFVMCVPRSQNAMQSCKVLPPPPATLGAASVELVLEPAGEAILSVLAEPPAVRIVVVTDGDNGARACAWGAGAPTADAGVGAAAVGGAGRAVAALILVTGMDAVAAAAADTAEGVDCCNSCWGCGLASRAAAPVVAARCIDLATARPCEWPPRALAATGMSTMTDTVTTAIVDAPRSPIMRDTTLIQGSPLTNLGERLRVGNLSA